ncbi:hypothetical protein RB195_017622 [Necator americanus]|uniref:Ammonium transporter AmtB-like domain-containing protein n=1 Tax=Necator americanus TaxID=51031 RepID=A0ABR1C8E3_NECAM
MAKQLQQPGFLLDTLIAATLHAFFGVASASAFELTRSSRQLGTSGDTHYMHGDGTTSSEPLGSPLH